jgi:hypothetical protein
MRGTVSREVDLGALEGFIEGKNTTNLGVMHNIIF